MTREDLIDARALIIAGHLKTYRDQVEAEPIMSEAKAATHAYRHARKLATAITDDDARIARVAKGAAA
ncbi:hypothetical protein [Brevundimonas pondensis]|uniref:Uncharacterized protein n=1 Tax=Brevundimonas pondensis TaxID=2774189 RepID=A0ABX7SNY6_9CAUL|nr:hypothetical protein [Brevundimonas pondensis]QTC88096.1 hypothetical protein IFE19_01425 [Brevundimonas pondensis]